MQELLGLELIQSSDLVRSLYLCLSADFSPIEPMVMRAICSDI
jgi:hypothetical protein